LFKDQIFIVLGGGLREDGKLPDYVLSRINLLADLSHMDDLIITSSSFSLNVPPKMDNNGFTLFESTEMAKELSKRGFQNVVTENWSHDTIGSAIFCRMLIESLGFSKSHIKVITSDFHFDRASSIFKWAFNELEPSYKPIEILDAKSPNLPKEDIIKRSKKEKLSDKSFNRNFKMINEFHMAVKKLLTNHDNYNINHTSKSRNVSDISLY
jgi:hypothetical protein